MKPLALLLATALACFGFAQSNLAEDAVMRLGEQTITLGEFDARFDFYVANLAASQNMPITEETRPIFEQLRPAYLEQLATEQLVLALGRARGLSVEEAYVDEQLAAIRGSFESEEAYREALEQVGISDELQLRVYVREAELSRQTVVALQDEVEIDDYQVRLFYDANREQFSQGEQSCAQHILVETLDEAEALATDLEAGAAFEELARERSLDTASAERGGDLGCFSRGQMVPSFEEAAFTTPVGSVSAPVESQFGYHLVLPYERSEASLVPLEVVEADIRAQLAQQVVRKVIEGYRETADLETFPERLGAPEVQDDSEGD